MAGKRQDGNQPEGRQDAEDLHAVDPKAIADRLRMAVKFGGGNQAVVDRVKELGGDIPLRTLSHYLSGVEMKTRPLVLLARACDVSLEWLASGKPPMHTHDRLVEFSVAAGAHADEGPIYSHAPGDGFTLVPRYDVHAPAGGGAVITAEEIVDQLAFKSSWLRDTLHVTLDKLALLTAIGDSMMPTINAGDVLLLELDPLQLVEGAIYVLEYEGYMKVKRIQRTADGTVIVRSDNPAYEADRIPPKKAARDLRIIGRVRWCGRVL